MAGRMGMIREVELLSHTDEVFTDLAEMTSAHQYQDEIRQENQDGPR